MAQDKKTVDLVAEAVDVKEVVEIVEPALTLVEADVAEADDAITDAMPDALVEINEIVEENIAEPVKVQKLQEPDCECMFMQSTTWHPVMGQVTDYAYRDQDGRNWGYDSSCGGQVEAD